MSELTFEVAADSQAVIGYEGNDELFRYGMQEILACGDRFKSLADYCAFLVGLGYIPRGVQAEPKQLFRVGSVYRQRKGDLVILKRGDSPSFGDDEVVAWEVSGNKFHRGARRLSDGKAYPYNTDESREYDLMPGEYIQRGDGQWIAADEEKTEQVFCDKLACDAADDLMDAMDAGAAASMGLRGQPEGFDPVTRSWFVATDSADADMLARDSVRALRPRLTWADTKPSDRFPGYTVKKFTQEQTKHQGLPAADLQEVSPLCGSAWLVLGE